MPGLRVLGCVGAMAVAVAAVLSVGSVGATATAGAHKAERRSSDNDTRGEVTCPPGYRVDGTACTEINECIETPSVCDARTQCENMPGSYQCGPCPPGFEGTGESGCVRVPSMDVRLGSVQFHVDETRDLGITTYSEQGHRQTSLRAAVSAAFAAETSVAEASAGLADVETSVASALSTAAALSSSLDGAWASLQEGTRRDEELASNITDLQEHISLGLSSGQEKLGELSTAVADKTNSLQEDQDTLSSYVSELEGSVSGMEDVLTAAVTRISSLESKLSTMEECSENNLVYKEGQCQPLCSVLSECGGTTCSEQNTGTLRYVDGALEVCDGAQFTVVSADTTGLTPLDPASSCQQLQELGHSTGVYYIGDGSNGTSHACDMSVTPARDLGGDGGERNKATTDCRALKNLFSLPSGQYWIQVEDDVAFVYCDVDTGEVHGDGSTAAFAGYSCKSIQTRYSDLGDGDYWITAGGTEAFKVTCVGFSVELQMQGSDFSSTGWVVSHSPNNNWYKCRCRNGLDRLKDRTGEWHIGTVADSEYTEECQVYFTVSYKSAGAMLSDANMLALSSLSKSSNNRNFEVYTTSCDDDGRSAPSGHWIGIEKTPGGDDYNTQDCTSGQGGGGHDSPTEATGNNEGCCDHKLSNDFDSFPFPLKGCGSINTGGGVALTFTTNVLLIHE